MTNSDARRVLVSAMRYIAAYYGGTLAHHYLACAYRRVCEE